MPKEQLRLLAGDVERLVSAGSNVAVGDVGLQKRGKALRELSAKVPVLKQIADAVDQTTQAKPGESGRKLLDLLLIVRQARASLTSVGVDGDMQPVPSSGPWETTSPVHEVEPLREALLGTGEKGFAEIYSSLEQKILGDLRLVQPILEGFANTTHTPRAVLIAFQVVPALGPVMAAELRQQFDPQGKSVDVRRLKVICKVTPCEGAELCRQVLAEGSRELKPVALGLLADLDPLGVESIGLEVLQQKSDQEFRAAAMKAVAHSTKDEALEALLKGVEDTAEVWDEARPALGKNPHPQMLPRLLAMLQGKLAAWDALQQQVATEEKPTVKGKGPVRSKQERQTDVFRTTVLRLLETLQLRRDPQCVEMLIPLLHHRDESVQESTIQALTATREPHAVKATAIYLHSSKEGLWRAATQAMALLSPEEHFERLAPRARQLFADRSKEQYQASAALATLLTKPPPGADSWDRRWGPLLLDLLKEYGQGEKALGLVRVIGKQSGFLAQAAERVLGADAFPPLAALLPVALKARDTSFIVALGELKTRETATALVDALSRTSQQGEWQIREAVRDALTAIGDKSILPWLREILQAHNPLDQHWVDVFLQPLEQLPNRNP